MRRGVVRSRTTSLCGERVSGRCPSTRSSLRAREAAAEVEAAAPPLGLRQRATRDLAQLRGSAAWDGARLVVCPSVGRQDFVMSQGSWSLTDSIDALYRAELPALSFSIELDAGGTADVLEDLQTDLRASHVALLRGTAEDDDDEDAVAGALTLHHHDEYAEILTLAVARAQRRHGAGSLLVRYALQNAAADGLRLVLVAAGDDVTDFWRGIGFRPPVAARVPSQWIETLQRRFTESTVLCYALDDEAGGADACERAVQASIERMGHREAGRAAKRHRR